MASFSPKFTRAVSFTHYLCGQFLSKVYEGSFIYTFFVWPVSLTHSKVYEGSFFYTLFMWPVSLQSLRGQFLLHIIYVASFSPKFTRAVSFTHYLCGQFLSLCGQFLLHILYVRTFFYTSHASYFVSWGVSLTYPVLTSLCGEFPLKEVFIRKMGHTKYLKEKTH